MQSLSKYNSEMKQEIVESYYEIQGFSPTTETTLKIAKQIPKDIHGLAKQWSWNDTEVRDKVYRFIRGNYNKI